ncbi:MAG: hypothetical protein K2X81_21465 [Candidatus Obscuribacterales bacterium]|nr:hypothetical protein [Candidatus Obscuribacterales bacterium]
MANEVNLRETSHEARNTTRSSANSELMPQNDNRESLGLNQSSNTFLDSARNDAWGPAAKSLTERMSNYQVVCPDGTIVITPIKPNGSQCGDRS